jgi:DNA replication protein DnaC
MTSDLAQGAFDLGLHGLVLHLDTLKDADWVAWLLDIEEKERGRRGLASRLKAARLGAFKPLSDFDWTWPKQLDRAQLEELFTLRFVEEQANPIFIGPNGVGKSMLAKNLIHRALLLGHTAQFLTASAMLNDLAAEDSASGLERRLRRLCRPRVLCIDEVGYLSYGNRHADLLFEVVTRRYDAGKPLIVTTNKPFSAWGDVFPSAGCVVTLVDRLVHRSEVVVFQGESYRLKEAKERLPLELASRLGREAPSRVDGSDKTGHLGGGSPETPGEGGGCGTRHLPPRFLVNHPRNDVPGLHR